MPPVLSKMEANIRSQKTSVNYIYNNFIQSTQLEITEMCIQQEDCSTFTQGMYTHNTSVCERHAWQIQHRKWTPKAEEWIRNPHRKYLVDDSNYITQRQFQLIYVTDWRTMISSANRKKHLESTKREFTGR